MHMNNNRMLDRVVKLVRILSCILLPWHPAGAQQLPVPNVLTVRDGLGFREVTAIIQDKAGLMWFGTRRGLDRYDGYRFLHLDNNPPADLPIPAGNIVSNCLLLRGDSALWFIADNALYSLDLRHYRTRRVEGSPDRLWQLKAGHDDAVWLVSEDDDQQYLWYYTSTNGFRKVVEVPRLRKEFTKLEIDTAGHAWWTTITQGLQCYNRDGLLLHEARLDSFDWFGTTMYFTPLHISSQQRIFIFPKSVHELWEYFPATGQVKVLLRDLATPVYFGIEDPQGNQWFATRQELFQLRPDGRFISYGSQLQQRLDFTYVNELFIDRANVLWVGTNGGLLKLPLRQQLFRQHHVQDSLNWGNAMRSMVEGANQQLYYYCEGGQPGLYQLDLQTGQTANFFPPDQRERGLARLEGIFHLAYDPRNNCLWTGADSLLRVSLADRTIEAVAPIPDGSIRNLYSPLVRFSDGHLLIGNFLDKLAFYAPEEGTLTPLSADLPNGIGHVRVKCLLAQDNDQCWVGTMEAGLFLLDRQGRVLRHYSTTTTPALSNDHILAIQADPTHDQLWVGTFGGGLTGINLSTNDMLTLSQADGLTDNNVVGIIRRDNRLWMATYNGLSCYDLDDETFQHFFVEDGLSNNEFNYTSYAETSDGQVHFGGLNGINSFFPDSLLLREPNPPMQWTGFLQYDRSRDSLYHYYSLQALDTPLVISPYINYFQLAWTLPNYARPSRNQYYSWLEGMEEGWTFLGHNPELRFNQLPPGEYTLHLRGADSRGNWGPNELHIPIRVKTIFFRSWWFLLLVAASLGSFGYWISRLRYRRRLEMERMRTRIASDLHDEVGSMLSGLAMQAELLELTSNSGDQPTLRYLRDISRQAVGKMRDMVWSIDSRRDQIQDLVDRMREQAEEVLSPRGIEYQFVIDDALLERQLPVNTRQHLYLIFREAITNICKHAGGVDQVWIRLVQRGGQLELTIRDNGQPCATPDNPTGLGLANMRMRANALHAALLIEQEQGFQIQILVPKGRW
ncbi:MAG: hypothetical protein KDC54_10350 [Lewinella sp.]|nr:hypothetical protein [Lewinella sp.]